MRKGISTIVLTVFLAAGSFAQQINLEVGGVKDTTVYLIKYVGSKLYYADTAQMVNGKVSFDGAKQKPGVVGLLLPGQKYFEFIYNGKPVSIQTKSPNFVENMEVKKGEENKIFLNYIQYMNGHRSKANELQKKKKQLDSTETDKLAEINGKIDGIGEEVRAYQEKIVKENPGLLVSKIIKMSTDVHIPNPPKKEDGSLVDSNFTYKYYRDHYFDNIDFSDDRLVNTPILQNKLQYFYSNKMLLQQPDTIIKYISEVINQIPEGTMMYRFFVTNITAHFERSKIMGMKKVMNFMIHQYYCAKDDSGNYKGYWMDTSELNDLCEKTVIRMKTEIGDVAPNIILPDSTNKKWYNLHKIKAEYKVLYFWDPNCGHCKEITPKLAKLYHKKLADRNVIVYAVGKATEGSFEDWEDFIQKHNLDWINVGVTKQLYKKATEDPYSIIPSKTTIQSINYQSTYDVFATPKVLLLDKDNKIIAKSLSIAQIEMFLDRLQGHKDAPKLFDIEKEEKKMQ